MIITANLTRLRVDFRMPGKFYSATPPEGTPPADSATNSDYPFDSKDLEVGESVTLPDDVTFLRVKGYTPVVDHGATPAGE